MKASIEERERQDHRIRTVVGQRPWRKVCVEWTRFKCDVILQRAKNRDKLLDVARHYHNGKVWENRQEWMKVLDSAECDDSETKLIVERHGDVLANSVVS